MNIAETSTYHPARKCWPNSEQDVLVGPGPGSAFSFFRIITDRFHPIPRPSMFGYKYTCFPFDGGAAFLLSFEFY
jgi:hypothetical protein